MHWPRGQQSRSHGYENRHFARLLVSIAAVLPAAVCLHVDTIAYIFGCNCFVRILRCLNRWHITAASNRCRRRTLHQCLAWPMIRCHHVRMLWPRVKIRQQSTQLFYCRPCSHLQHRRDDLFLSTSLSTKVLYLVPDTFITWFDQLCAFVS